MTRSPHDQWRETHPAPPPFAEPDIPRRIPVEERVALWIGTVIFLLIPGRAALSLILGAIQ